MKDQNLLNNWSYSNNRAENVSKKSYIVYDWIEVCSNYRGVDALGQTATVNDVMKYIVTTSECRNMLSNTTWQNGFLVNESTGRKLWVSACDKGYLRVKVCPPKYILGNNVEEVSIVETLNLFTALSDMVGYDLGGAKLNKVDVTHTAITDFPPVAYFPMLCHQNGEKRWILDSTLYYGTKGAKQKKFYDKPQEVNKRKTWGGKQRMPEQLKGKDLTRFEVSLGTHKNISMVLGEDATLGHLFSMEHVEKLHNYWVKEYTDIPKNTELNLTLIEAMGKKQVKEAIHLSALSSLGRTKVEEAIVLASKLGAVNRQELYKLKKEMLTPFEEHATKHDLIIELDKKMEGFEPKWE